MTRSDSPVPRTIMGGIDPATQHAMAGETFLSQGKWADAKACYTAAIKCAPNNTRFHWSLGVCDDKLGRPDWAMESFQRASRFDPKFAFAHASMGSWFLNNGMIEAALEASDRALKLIPGNHSIMELRMRCLEVSGREDEAWKMLQALLAVRYGSPITLMVLARLAKRHHQTEPALAILRQVIGTGKMLPTDLAGLHFATAGLLDSLERYDHAFAHARVGNELRKPAYDRQAHQRTFDTFIEYFRRERLASLPRASERDETPVFIVGMPRSGTSLVEQILASHPQVHGGGELDFMYQIWNGAIGMLGAKAADYPPCLDRLTQDQIDGLAQVYLQPLKAMNPQAQRITDKLPLNFLHLGLIEILFPGARVIHCRRDAMDTCLSCYFTSFREGHEFKYDLKNLGHFYRQYERLMAHWKTNLDVPILDVQYEELIADAPGQSRRMVEFLGLPWSDRCLQFDRTVRPVATASLHQVRKPVYRSSIQRWRNYEKHLGDLITSLSAESE